jgi:hypothetical protein
MRDTVEKLRKILPPFLTVPEYCKLMNRCEASAYHDLRNKPGLGVKIGGSTRFVTEAVLNEMLRLPAWIPQKDRARKAKAATRPKKQTATPRREYDPEVRP